MSLGLRHQSQFLRYCSVKSAAHPAIQLPLLDLRNVRVMRGENVVLDDLSLRIQPDEHVAVLGPNGCGKSTLIKTITRECYPVAREGSSMTILGQQSWNVFELRSLLGIVSNDLMASCTGEASGLDVVLSGFSAAPAFSRITPSIRNTKNGQGSRWTTSGYCIWRGALCKRCRRVRPSAC